MQQTNGTRRLLTPADVSRVLGVPADEVLGWIDSGRLKAQYIRAGRYRIALDDFLAFRDGAGGSI